MVKKIIRSGNSCCLVLNKVAQEISGIVAGDTVEVKCSKNKLIIMKKEM